MSGKVRKVVATRRAREWRLNLLDRWLSFAFDASTSITKLSSELAYLARYTMSSGWAMPALASDADLAALHWLRDRAKKAIAMLADSGGWEESLADQSDLISELRKADRALTLRIIKGKTGFSRTYDGHAKSIGLLAIQALKSHPEAHRFTRCAEPGCPAIFVQRKAGRFCHDHTTSAARARRFHASLTPAEKTAKRRQTYLNWLRRYKPKRYRHLKKAEKATASA